jgi:photosystem II stability/assembly factor-like uncharacterized protein
MRTFLIILFSFGFLFCVFQPDNIYSQTWIRQQTPTNLWLNKCSFPDSLNGWAAGEDGVILHTSNGGTNWSMQNSPVNFFIYDIYFLNTRLGWAIADDNFPNRSAILSTTNGGVNWTYYRYPDSTFLLYSVFFRDSLNGYMAGYGGTILRTSNGGNNWLFALKDSLYASLSIYKVSFYNENTGFAAGGSYDIAGRIWNTTNGGLNWISNALVSEPLFCFDILSPSKVISLGGDFDYGAIQAKTFNGGGNWIYDYLYMFGEARGVSFRTESEGWAVLGFAARFAYTLDTANTWHTMNVPDTSSLYDIIFTDPFHGWAVGTKGSVYKYNAQTIGINNNHNSVPLAFKLYQNYPNPFNPTTKIKFDVPSAPLSFGEGNAPYGAGVRLIIFDALGREIQTLLREKLNPGTYEVDFNGNNLPSGIYFYKLTAGNYSDAKKMVLIK